jgi:hypothetical protein
MKLEVRSGDITFTLQIWNLGVEIWKLECKVYKKGKVVSRQPIFIVNLKSNTMKNTMQI